ncbi:hypothetical protein [Pseudomonas helleri]|uniref:hypothetical protein n=1 Tax=Pseudomonas helleri TaxID=1608996 RepID=UPI0030DAFB20
MGFGLGTWDAAGVPELNENSFTMRVVLSEVVTFGGREVKSFSVPGCTPANSVAIVIPLGGYSDNDRQFETEMGNGIAYVANYMRYYAGDYTATGSMRLIVTRFA